MKNNSVILIIMLVAIGITIFLSFKFIASLKWQNNALSANIDQITKRITALELDKTMEQIAALKAKNIVLKKEIEDLRRELSRVSKNIAQQSSKVVIKKEETIVGNRGFLIKNSKPTQ